MNLLGVTLQIKKIQLAKTQKKNKINKCTAVERVTHTYLLHECICSISHFWDAITLPTFFEYEII